VGQDILHVPQIDHELAESLRVLAELEARLPAIRTQAAQVRVVYDSGRQKVAYLVIHTSIHTPSHDFFILIAHVRQAEALVQDLRWLNRGRQERWYEVIFTSNGPVSWRWRATLRTLFALAFMVAAWLVWMALLGVTRAHRQRLVWGERLPS
jgi:hypothetical protein